MGSLSERPRSPAPRAASPRSDGIFASHRCLCVVELQSPNMEVLACGGQKHCALAPVRSFLGLQPCRSDAVSFRPPFLLPCGHPLWPHAVTERRAQGLDLTGSNTSTDVGARAAAAIQILHDGGDQPRDEAANELR